MARLGTNMKDQTAVKCVIVTALLMMQPRWKQGAIAEAVNGFHPFVSNVKKRAIQLGLMDDNRYPTAEGRQYLEWAKQEYDLLAYVKKIQ